MSELLLTLGVGLLVLGAVLLAVYHSWHRPRKAKVVPGNKPSLPLPSSSSNMSTIQSPRAPSKNSSNFPVQTIASPFSSFPNAPSNFKAENELQQVAFPPTPEGDPSSSSFSSSHPRRKIPSIDPLEIEAWRSREGLAPRKEKSQPLLFTSSPKPTGSIFDTPREEESESAPPPPPPSTSISSPSLKKKSSSEEAPDIFLQQPSQLSKKRGKESQDEAVFLHEGKKARTVVAEETDSMDDATGNEGGDDEGTAALGSSTSIKRKHSESDEEKKDRTRRRANDDSDDEDDEGDEVGGQEQEDGEGKSLSPNSAPKLQTAISFEQSLLQSSRERLNRNPIVDANPSFIPTLQEKNTSAASPLTSSLKSPDKAQNKKYSVSFEESTRPRASSPHYDLDELAAMRTSPSKLVPRIEQLNSIKAQIFNQSSETQALASLQKSPSRQQLDLEKDNDRIMALF